MTDVADPAGRPSNPSILKWDAAAFSYIQNSRIDNVPDPMPGEMIPGTLLLVGWKVTEFGRRSVTLG